MEFGYTRKDIILIGAGLLGTGYALYYGAQAFGIEATKAGNYVQLFVFLVICVGYISTYIFRVANKVRTTRVMEMLSHQLLDSESARLFESRTSWRRHLLDIRSDFGHAV